MFRIVRPLHESGGLFRNAKHFALRWTSSHGLGDNDYAFLDSRNGLEVDRSVASTLNGSDARACSSDRHPRHT